MKRFPVADEDIRVQKRHLRRLGECLLLCVWKLRYEEADNGVVTGEHRVARPDPVDLAPRYPETTVWFIGGGGDTTGSLRQGLTYYDRMLRAGSPKVRLDILPNAPHGECTPGGVLSRKLSPSVARRDSTSLRRSGSRADRTASLCSGPAARTASKRRLTLVSALGRHQLFSDILVRASSMRSRSMSPSFQ